MQCQFVVGQRVVCMNDHFAPKGLAHLRAWSEPCLPAKDQVYTVRKIEAFDDATYLFFTEIVNPVIPFQHGMWEQGFDHRRFRPLTERKSDISVFTKMLNQTKVSSHV